MSYQAQWSSVTLLGAPGRRSTVCTPLPGMSHTLLVDAPDDSNRRSSINASSGAGSSSLISSSSMSSSGGDFSAAHFFEADATSIAAGVSLSSLNTPPPQTMAGALAQLQVAKAYIARAQQESTRRNRDASSSAGKTARSNSNAATERLLPSSYSSTNDGGGTVLELESPPPSQTFGNGFVYVPPPEQSPEDYYATPWYKLVLKRLPWLVALLLLQSFGALILNRYDKLIGKHLVLNFFIPMMQGTSGNAGNQPGVMVTRALSLGKLKLGELLSKETPVALTIALSLAVVAYFRIRLVYPDDPGSAASIAIALFCAVVLAVSLSIVFSVLLARITCCDPADGAVPLLSTCSDVVSILLLVVIASSILPYPGDQ